MIVALGLVVAACGGGGVSASPSGSGVSSEVPSEQPFESSGTFEPMAYPEEPAECGFEGDADHGPYAGEFSQIRAIDETTVEFELCYPDVSFLQKIAFSSFAILDTASLENDMENHRVLARPNGTGPFMITEWQRGDHITMVRNPNYWGEAPSFETLIFRWSVDSAQRFVELQAGAVDGIDNPGPEDFAAIEGDSAFALFPREGLNTFYVGFNNNPQIEGYDNSTNPFADQAVRQAVAMGIDRQQIVDNFYPPGSEVASHFTPCAITFACVGDPWYEFDAEAAQAMLADAGYPDGFSTTIHLRDVVRGYLPNPTQVATEIQTQLRENLNIEASIDVQESGTYIDNADAGALDGIHLLGWGADYPDMTNFLDYHFGGGASAQFGDKFDDLVEVLQVGATSTEDADREAAYVEANNLIREYVPMVPIAHGGSATAFQADVENAHSSPLSNEQFAGMVPGDRDQLVWMQNAEPIGLYCADESDGESLRACEQINESLYAYEVGGTAAEPALATECTTNEDGTLWTCTLRDDVTFHNGARLDANDVVLSYAVQWDLEHPLHIGRDGSFTYFSALFGGFLNNPPAEE
ncbi:MAG TPA: ABC transporter substrate-binding protein [Candidatus Limnocylindria bacterium]|nr:ABC transporter substrate-binding protein [Candidatus Limnocylindria bacterium]